MANKYIFPENFWWGSATSGPQSEGNFNKKNKNVFDYWYEIEPDAFFDKVGPNIASNFYNSYKEDIAMIKEIERVDGLTISEQEKQTGFRNLYLHRPDAELSSAKQ